MIADNIQTEIIQEMRLNLLEGKPGIFKPMLDSLMEKYEEKVKAKILILKRQGELTDSVRDNIIEEFKSGLTSIVNEILNSPILKDQLYNQAYERLKALPDQGRDAWGNLLQEIYSDEAYLNEIFVRLVEEQEGVKITSAKQLQEITGITEVYGEIDEETGELIPYGDKKPTKAEAKAEATRQLQEIFTTAMYYRYSKALEGMLEAGATYKDLLQVKPKEFNLPGDWGKIPGCLGTNQATTILWAIAFTLLISEGVRDEGVGRLIYNPSLRDIAKEIEAPYSVVMEAFKLVG